MKGSYAIVFLIIQFLTHAAHAQLTENQGWLFLTHTQKLNKNFDLLVDAQTRTSNKYDYLNTLLLRGGLSYNLNDKHALAIGFAYKGDREKTENEFEYSGERRIFEQYLYSFKITKIEMMLRVRLEQRWIKDEQTDFSQRVRLFIASQIPLFANTEFSKGIYTAIQNEIFINVTNKQSVNNHLFDQNRSFISAGYRWSKAVDTEIGYMYWHQLEKEDTFKRNVIQLQITSNF